MKTSEQKAFVGHYLSPLVYGANDGIITTFAVVSGAAGATLAPEVIIILGIANLFADGFSMGVSSYLSMKSEQEYEREKDIDVGDLKHNPTKHGAATFVSFVVAGSLPLIPFIFLDPTRGSQFLVSAVATGIAFFVVGSSRSYLLDKSAWKAGLEMLLVGGSAAVIAFTLGWIVHGFVV